MPSDFISDERGVSEVVGFVLVFSLVIGTITAVYVGGLAGLDRTRDAERVNNAERAFDVMANNFQQMGRGDAPNRATEIKLADAQLGTTAQRGITVNASGISGASASPVAIRYDTPGGDTSLVYEHGAVIRVEETSAVMLREPDWLFSSDAVVVRFMKLRSPGGQQSVGGSASTVLVRAETKDTSVLVNRGSSSPINVSVKTHPDRTEVWRDYLQEQLKPMTTGSVDCGESSDSRTVRCEGGSTQKLAVSQVQIEVTLT